MREHKNQPGRIRGTGSKAYAATRKASKLARNIEAEEQAIDAQFHTAHTIWQTDLYDSAQDARSEARYEDDPQAEPTQAESDPVFACIVDESAGFRG